MALEPTVSATSVLPPQQPSLLRSLRGKLLFLFLGLALLPLAGVSMLLVWQSDQEVRQQVEANVENVVVLESQAIDAWLAERLDNMLVVAGTARVRTMDTAKAGEAIKQYFDQWGVYENMALYGLDGTTLYRTDSKVINVADRDYFQSAARGQPFFSDPLISKASGNLVFVVAAPVVVDGKAVGVVSGALPTSAFDPQLQSARLGQTGELYLINRQGKFLTTSRFAAELKSTGVITDRVELALGVDSVGAQQVLAGQVGVSEYWVDYRHATVVGAYHPIARTGWGLLAEQDRSEALAATTVLFQITLGALGLAAVLVVVAALMVVRSLVNPIRDMTSVAQGLANGDASQTVSFQSRDEVGALAAAFRAMLAYLQRMTGAADQIANGDLTTLVAPASEKDALGYAFERMIEQVRETVRQVAQNAAGVRAAASHLTTAANEASRATTQQTAAATQTAASVEEMKQAIDGVAKGAQEQAAAVGRAAALTAQISSAIQLVAGHVQSVAEESAGAAGAARNGAQVVTETVQGMEKIKVKVGVSAAKVQEMGQRSREIGVIVEKIEDIASQTNLLALNAAIEAARAGEHGAGFAVVAGEVRKLAERAALATREISGLVRGIQQTAAEAVTAMNTGTEEVEHGAERATEAKQVLVSILTAAEGVKQRAESAYLATQEMSNLSTDLVTATDSVSAVVEQNTAATEEMAAGAAEVAAAIATIAQASEDMNAQTLEVTTSAAGLDEMAQALQAAIALFQIGEAGRGLAVSTVETADATATTASGALIAGTGFIYRRDFVREQYREAGWQKVLARLTPGAARLIAGALVPTGKYPQAAYAELIAAIKAEFGGAHAGALAQQMARYVAKAEANGVYHSILNADTPQGMLGRLPALWRVQAAGGEFKATQTGPRSFTLVLNHKVDAELCQSSLLGYMEGLLELVGVERPVVKHTACLHRGGANCRYDVSW
jgi:methyl-accepting chemotaxis protein